MHKQNSSEEHGNDDATAAAAGSNIDASQHFTKHYDVKSGKFYYVIKATNEITWDKPKGKSIPLERNNGLLPITFPKRHNAKEEEERKFIIGQKRAEYEKEKKRNETRIKSKREEYERKCWRKECMKGVEDNGKVQVDWKKFGYISKEIYTFETNNPEIKLVELSLNGNDLDSIKELPVYCSNIRRLSLACNNIRHLDGSIEQLSSLTTLNLLRNNLESLPDSIGNLRQLQILDVSHNSLTTIPESIGNLNQIKVLNLECNKLEEIPNVFDKMNCEIINLNSNRLIELPTTIGEMKNLKRLLVNDNKVIFLPIQICYLKTLKILHMSRNFIKELPNAIGQLSSLESLWLDSNKLSALPSNFYLLSNLKELQLECNWEMINPSMETIVKGPQEVLNWCALKLAKKNYMRKRNIVMAMQDLLEQVRRLKLDGGDNQPHEAIFEADVMYKGELYYQFLMHIFWTSFLPKLRKIWANSSEEQLKSIVSSFPYERWEVEQALLQFQDAAGYLTHFEKRAKFKACCCIEEKGGGGKRCSLQDKDWDCQRAAILLRKNLILETLMTERKRRQVEEERIDQAAEAATKTIKQYLRSDEGKVEVRALAEQKIKARKNSNSQINKEFYKQTPRKYRNAIELLVGCLPQKTREEREIKEEMLRIQDNIISQEVDSRKNRATEVNSKLRMVLKAWIGLTTDEIFSGWKNTVFELKNQRAKDKMTKEQELNRLELENKEKELMALRELQLWERKWDIFQDIPYWQHALTNEIMWGEPTVEYIIEVSRWSFPPKSDFACDLDSLAKRVNNAKEKESFNAATNILKRRRASLLKNK